MTQVRTVFNYVPKVLATISGDTLESALKAGAAVVEGHAKVNVEKTFSGKSTGGAGLGGSIQVMITQRSGESVKALIGPTVVYGRIQELGGTIRPVRAKMLSWVDKDTGERVFANAVTLPARPYLRPALDENKDEIDKAMAVQIAKGIKAVLP